MQHSIILFARPLAGRQRRGNKVSKIPRMSADELITSQNCQEPALFQSLPTKVTSTCVHLPA